MVLFRNYDVEKEYGRMREAGIFTAIRPSDEWATSVSKKWKVLDLINCEYRQK